MNEKEKLENLTILAKNYLEATHHAHNCGIMARCTCEAKLKIGKAHAELSKALKNLVWTQINNGQ